MERCFLETNQFRKTWVSSGLSEDDLRELQLALCMRPNSGDVIQGTGGLRKLRIGLPGRGKRGGGRLIYCDFPELGWLVLITLYSKNTATDLDALEKKALSHLVKEIEISIRKRFYGE